MQTINHTSPHLRDEEASDYASDPFWQFEDVKAAAYKYVTQNRGSMADLRGQSFTITVAEDGLHVTVTDVTAETSTDSATASNG